MGVDSASDAERIEAPGIAPPTTSSRPPLKTPDPPQLTDAPESVDVTEPDDAPESDDAPEPIDETEPVDAPESVEASSDSAVASNRSTEALSEAADASEQTEGVESIAPPQPLPDNPPPQYPREIQSAGLQGRVLLRVAVDADGAVAHLSVYESSGHHRLDELAIDAVAKWRFTPARRGPLKTEMETLVPIRFRLAN